MAASITLTRPTLFVEAKLKTFHPLAEGFRAHIRDWITQNFVQVRVGDYIEMRGMHISEHIQSLRIVEHSQIHESDMFHLLSEHDLDVAVYHLSDLEDEVPSSDQDQDDVLAQFRILLLPHKSLEGVWESLVYKEPIPESMLRILTRMIEISKEGMDPAIITFQNLALLYGPPGSGKTTLAHALAQKLSIRLGRDYAGTKLIEVNSTTLTSKWFGESGKLVGKLFDTITTLSADDTVLIVVVIDEVETIAGSREKALQSNEVGDAIRSTNELLQGLDRIRLRSNVVFICTSNLRENIDAAFVDRCGIEQSIGIPSIEGSYEIFRSVINELIKAELVIWNPSSLHDQKRSSTSDVPSGESSVSGLSSTPPQRDMLVLGGMQYLPDIHECHSLFGLLPESAPRELRRLSKMAGGLSGRTLRRLPMLSLAKYTTVKPCDIWILLDAMKMVINEKLGQSGAASKIEDEIDLLSESERDDSNEICSAD